MSFLCIKKESRWKKETVKKMLVIYIVWLKEKTTMLLFMEIIKFVSSLPLCIEGFQKILIVYKQNLTLV